MRSGVDRIAHVAVFDPGRYADGVIFLQQLANVVSRCASAEEQRDAGNALPYLPGHGQTLLRVLPAEEQTVGKRLVDALPGRFVQRLGAQRDAVALPDVSIRWNAHSAPW